MEWMPLPAVYLCIGQGFLHKCGQESEENFTFLIAFTYFDPIFILKQQKAFSFSSNHWSLWDTDRNSFQTGFKESFSKKKSWLQ